MADRLEIENAEQCKALFALLNDSEKQTVRAVLRYIDEANLMPEQSLLVELGVLEKLLHDVQAGSTIAALITDIDAYAEAAIKEIGEEVRRERHIGALMGGIALCAIVLLVLGLYGIARGLANGQALMACTTSLDLGHVICFIAFLAGTRFFVMGDKNANYNDPRKARNRTQLVGFLFIVGFLALVASAFFDLPVVLVLPSVYVLVAALLLLVLWKLSGRL